MDTKNFLCGEFKNSYLNYQATVCLARGFTQNFKKVNWHQKGQLLARAYQNKNNLNDINSSKYEVKAYQDVKQNISADIDVDVVKVVNLPVADSLHEAKSLLEQAINSQSNQKFSNLTSGLVRYEVYLPNSETTPLSWLQTQTDKISDQICMYFGSRLSSAPGTPGMDIAQRNTCCLQEIAGIGAACVENYKLNWKVQYNSIKPFLKKNYPQIRAFAALRFLGEGKIQSEWADFGEGIVLIPAIEFKREDQHSVISATVAWRKNGNFMSFQEAAQNSMNILSQIDTENTHLNKGCGVLESEDQISEYNPDHNQWNSSISQLLDKLQEDDSINQSKNSAFIEKQTAFQQYLEEGQEGLDNLLSVSQIKQPPTIQQQIQNKSKLTKVVMARQTKFECKGKIDPLGVLQIQKSKNPCAYQIAIILPSGTAYVSSTPERLYVRSGTDVATEAVAGTRPRGPRGDIKKDFEYSMDLLQNPKDHVEFCSVRDWIREALEGISEKNTVLIEREKSLIKQATVQHLYGCLYGKIKSDISDRDILDVLHPTPAVCGRPQNLALEQIVQFEDFDRGLYAGPIGWISGSAAEFAVAIRSALFTPTFQEQKQFQETGFNFCTQVIMYSGVGVIKASCSESEWRELNLKILQYQKILLPPLSVFRQPNLNLVWTHLLFEEFARQGVDTVCIAPGSRSSALVLGAAQNPQLRVVVCIDERSLGFWAVGYGRATKRPAVIVTSSGTAVANLLPSVVEASQSNVPMIVCSADRPMELRDTGANQTIDQVGIFGCYVRYQCDLDAPSRDVGGRFVLSTAGTVYGHAAGRDKPGPVHLNCQFREPLSPRLTDWDRQGGFMRGIHKWQNSLTSYTQPPPYHAVQTLYFSDKIQRKILQAESGLLVVGELRDEKDVRSVIKLARSLQWAIVADVLSGMRVGINNSTIGDSPIIYHMDQILTDRDNWHNFQPHIICHVGDHLLSKRLQQFMEWCVLDSSSCTEIVQIKKHEKRNDPSNIISHSIVANEIPQLSRPHQISQAHRSYNRFLIVANSHVARCIKSRIESTDMCEPHIAHVLSQVIPQHHALFLGNSMPIRDMDMFSQPRCASFLQNLQNCSYSTQNFAISSKQEENNCNGCTLFQKNNPNDDIQFQFDPNKVYQYFKNNNFTQDSKITKHYNKNGHKSQQIYLEQSDIDKNSFENENISANCQNNQFSSDKDCIGVAVGSNRGASGIDGVISTAVGFSAGQDRPTTLVIGDVSFLHDTNGLAFLTSSSSDFTTRCPVTVVVINNNGGGIFEFLPLAKTISKEQLDHLWTTPQSVDIGTLCQAHGVLHVRVQNVEQLKQSLEAGWQSNQHNVIEVLTDRSLNHAFHIELNEMSKKATQRAIKFCLELQQGVISDLRYNHYKLPLEKQLTTDSGSNFREGLVVSVGLRFGNGVEIRGEGEVSPLPGLHQESLADCKGQVAGLSELIQNVQVPSEIVLLDGTFVDFWRQYVGICAENLYPCVRFGVEIAVIDALKKTANRGEKMRSSETGEDLKLNGLIGNISQQEAVKQAKEMVNNGVECIKIKVGCRCNPLEDSEVIGAVRSAVGPNICLRADANRRWSFQQALTFGHAAYQYSLQYIEEPTKDPHLFQNFFLATGIPYAIDETLDQIFKNRKQNQTQFSLLQNSISDMGMSSGLRGVIVKPMLIGSADHVLEIAKWAKKIDCQTVISSCFETTIGINFLKYLAQEVNQIYGKELFHGLGTLSWYKSDELNEFYHSQHTFEYPKSFVEKKYSFNTQSLQNEQSKGVVIDENNYFINNSSQSISSCDEISIKTVQLIGQADKPGLIFLHGMFGCAEDWAPVMRNIHEATKSTCIAFDLNLDAKSFSIDSMADAIRITMKNFEQQNFCQGFGVVGYSMGGRVTFNLLVKYPSLFNFAVLISSSPGIQDENLREKRFKIDQARSAKLQRLNCLTDFIDSYWYMHEMWGNMRENPRYVKLLEQRSVGDVKQSAWALETRSPGNNESLWDEIQNIQIPVLFVAGKQDEKYCQIGRKLTEDLNSSVFEMVDCGHAVHFEMPIELTQLILNFLL